MPRAALTQDHRRPRSQLRGSRSQVDVSGHRTPRKVLQKSPSRRPSELPVPAGYPNYLAAVFASVLTSPPLCLLLFFLLRKLPGMCARGPVLSQHPPILTTPACKDLFPDKVTFWVPAVPSSNVWFISNHVMPNNKGTSTQTSLLNGYQAPSLRP